jgi:hypothetical protein
MDGSERQLIQAQEKYSTLPNLGVDKAISRGECVIITVACAAQCDCERWRTGAQMGRAMVATGGVVTRRITFHRITISSSFSTSSSFPSSTHRLGYISSYSIMHGCSSCGGCKTSKVIWSAFCIVAWQAPRLYHTVTT